MEDSAQNTNLNTVEMPASNIGDRKSRASIVPMVACAILVVAGVGFGVYALMSSAQKNQQIAELEAKIDDKDSKIEDLETKVSILKLEATEVSSDTESTDVIPDTEEPADPTLITPEAVARIVLGDKIDENDTRTVYKIGDCSADGPSVKCEAGVNGKQGLISYVDTDNYLRLTIPKE